MGHNYVCLDLEKATWKKVHENTAGGNSGRQCDGSALVVRVPLRSVPTDG